MVWAVVLLAFGLVFALAPLSVARATGHFRYVPYPPSPTPQQMRYFRLSGVVIAAAGVVLMFIG